MKKEHKGSYVVKVTPGENCNEEWTPEEELVDGIEVDGFILIAKRGNDIAAEEIYQMSLMDVATILANNTELSSFLRQAFAIAEGFRKADEIKKTDERKRIASQIAGGLFGRREFMD